MSNKLERFINLIISTFTISDLMMKNNDEFINVISILNNVSDIKDIENINNKYINKAIKEIKNNEKLKYILENEIYQDAK